MQSNFKNWIIGLLEIFYKLYGKNRIRLATAPFCLETQKLLTRIISILTEFLKKETSHNKQESYSYIISATYQLNLWLLFLTFQWTQLKKLKSFTDFNKSETTMVSQSFFIKNWLFMAPSLKRIRSFLRVKMLFNNFSCDISSKKNRKTSYQEEGEQKPPTSSHRPSFCSIAQFHNFWLT